MRHHRSMRLLGIAFAVVTFSSVGRAKEPASSTPSGPLTTVEGGYGYEFSDDVMQAGAFTPEDPRIVVPTHISRVTLIRPRTAFVAELLKSVENL
ncbi:MAG: hypothetical protein M3O36_14885 [Myxococcota bacterium]|nr:hypothetical protein [Myxococcota bacterium]